MPLAIRYLLQLVLMQALLLALAWPAAAADRRFPAPLAIVHTNDGWGMLNPAQPETIFYRQSLPPGADRLGGLARRAYMVRLLRRDYGARMLLLEAGGILGPFLDSFVDRGKALVAAMNEMGYQAWALGNSDYAFGLETLRQRIGEARFPVLAANVSEAATGRPLARDYIMIDAGGLRVAVLGLSSDNVPQAVPPGLVDGLVFRDPVAVARELVPRIQAAEAPDLIVALADVEPEQEAALLNVADVVVGGLGSRALFPLGLVQHQQAINGRFALHAGAGGLFLGLAELTLGLPQRIDRLEPSLLPVDADLYPDAEVAAGVPVVQKLVDDANEQIRAAGFRDVIGHLDAPLFHGPRQLLPLLLEVMRDRAHAEVALLNYGFAAHSENVNSAALQVTYDQVYAQLPWRYDLATVSLTGAQLRRLYDATRGLEGQARLYQVGLAVGPRGQLLVNGRELEEQATYSVATSSYLAEGNDRAYAILARGRQRTGLRRSIRQVLIDYLWTREQRGEVVSMGRLRDFYEEAFWKPVFALALDTLPTIVDVPTKRYKDLAWRNDQNSIQWGGALALGIRGQWGRNDLQIGLLVNYRQSNYLNGKFSVSSDSLAYDLSYQHWTIPPLLLPYARMRVESVLVYQDLTAPRFLLGQWGVGVEHRFGRFSTREGLELRHQLLDPADPWRLGPVWRVGYNDTIWDCVEIGLSANLIGSFNPGRDGLTTEIDAVLRVPISDLVYFRYRLQAFQNSLLGPWALRNSGGLGLGLEGGWVW